MRAKTETIQNTDLMDEKTVLLKTIQDLNTRLKPMTSCLSKMEAKFRSKMYHLQENIVRENDERAAELQDEMFDLSKKIEGCKFAISLLEKEIRDHQVKMLAVKIQLREFM